jgi:hypothetical protein
MQLKCSLAYLFYDSYKGGYRNRPNNFPLSVGLIGLRDVRDYKVASGGSERLNTSSPFNIKVRSITLRNFNATEVQELYQQHTHDTRQVFTKEATQTAFDLTQGQRWLVNTQNLPLDNLFSGNPIRSLAATAFVYGILILYLCFSTLHITA